MERLVPETIGQPIDLYIRTYYSLLRSSGNIRVRSLEETHAGMHSSLHVGADSPDVDPTAFLYVTTRLPTCIHQVGHVILGQTEEVFALGGVGDVRLWQRVDAPARRRRMLFDGHDTIAAFVSSVSDIDDLIPCLTAYQIEWNKLHQALCASPVGRDLASGALLARDARDAIAAATKLDDEHMNRLAAIWQADWDDHIRALASRPMDLRITSLASGFNNYRKAVQGWWDDLAAAAANNLEGRAVYFVSSNPHSLPNLISGFASTQRTTILEFLERENPEGLAAEWQRLEQLESEAAQANFLYYVQRYMLRNHAEAHAGWKLAEAESGIFRFDDPGSLDITAQVIALNRFDPARMDARVVMPGMEALRRSNAVIINVDYPLGFAAYLLFAQVASRVARVLGVYIMGKAATLNGRLGDVMIPNATYDEHSQNTYLFRNCFQAQDVRPYLLYGDVFDNQKSITVRGTFLQNREFMGVFYREGYTDIEMESGAYLSGVYEDIYPRRYPQNEIVNLSVNTPYDIGILHYASDTPYSQRRHMLSKSMSYLGVDSTYACASAILRRIVQTELARLNSE